jgi:hypothetical protein
LKLLKYLLLPTLLLTLTFSSRSSFSNTQGQNLVKNNLICLSPDANIILNHFRGVTLEQSKAQSSDHLQKIRDIKKQALMWAIFWTALFYLCLAYLFAYIFSLAVGKKRARLAYALISATTLTGLFFGYHNPHGVITSAQNSISEAAKINGTLVSEKYNSAHTTLVSQAHKKYNSIEHISQQYHLNNLSLPHQVWHFFGWDEVWLVDYELKTNEALTNEVNTLLDIVEKIRDLQKSLCRS